MPTKYTLKRADRANSPTPLKAGDAVYSCKYHDYGLAGDDTRGSGVEHTSVTLDPEGNYPFFTVPVMDLEPARG